MKRLAAILILLLLPCQLWATAYTRNASGNWSESAKWTPTGTPGDGDTVDLSTFNVTVDQNTTIGPDTFTTAIGGGSTTGTFTIDTGITLTVKGNIVIGKAFTMNAGSTLSFSATNAYIVRVGTAGIMMTFNGSSGSHVTIKTASAGANNAYFSRSAANQNRITATYTDFVDIGTSAHPIQFADPTLSNCTFNQSSGCGGLQINDVAAGDPFSFQHIDWLPAASVTNWFTISALTAPTGGALRQFSDISVFGGTTIIGGDVTDLTIDDYYTNKGVTIGTSGTSSGAFGHIDNLCVYGTMTAAALKCYAPGPITRSVFMRNDTIHTIDWHDDNAGTFSASSCIFGITHDATGGDSIVQMPCTNHSTSTYSIHNNFVDWGPGGAVADTLYNSASNTKGITVNIYHNTVKGAQTSVIEGTLESTGVGHTGHVGRFDSNICVYDSGTKQYALEQFASFRTSNDFVDTGTLTAADATSFTCAGKAWGTIFTDNPHCRILITSGTPAGLSTQIESNASTTKGNVTAWNGSVTPAGTETFKIFVDAIFDKANVNYNCINNGKATGTIHRWDNTDTTSVNGYDGYFVQTGLPGANDLWNTNPSFYDSTRSFATYDTASSGLNNAAGTAWSGSSVSYVVGNIVSNSNAGAWGGATINYRCIVAHTSGSTTEPGVGVNWRTNWELATGYRLRGDRSLIDNYITWQFVGIKPTNSALRNAGSDGVTIGAVEGQFPKGALWWYISRNALERAIFAQTNNPLSILTER